LGVLEREGDREAWVCAYFDLEEALERHVDAEGLVGGLWHGLHYIGFSPRVAVMIVVVVVVVVGGGWFFIR
jgi:hypothetical protein